MFRKEEYPDNWPELRRAVLLRANNRCEGSPAFPDCRAENGKLHPVTGSRVVLTTAHKHGTSKMTQSLDDLMALCQRCHLFYDLPHHMRNAAETRRRKRLDAGQLPLLPDSVTDDSDISPTHGADSARCAHGGAGDRGR